MQKLTTFGYDNVGNQTSVLDANQHQTQFVYDKLGRNDLPPAFVHVRIRQVTTALSPV